MARGAASCRPRIFAHVIYGIVHLFASIRRLTHIPRQPRERRLAHPQERLGRSPFVGTRGSRGGWSEAEGRERSRRPPQRTARDKSRDRRRSRPPHGAPSPRAPRVVTQVNESRENGRSALPTPIPARTIRHCVCKYTYIYNPGDNRGRATPTYAMRFSSRCFTLGFAPSQPCVP